jgi:hypothetical protein
MGLCETLSFRNGPEDQTRNLEHECVSADELERRFTSTIGIGGYGPRPAAFAKASAPLGASPGEALAETGRRGDGNYFFIISLNAVFSTLP